MSDGSVITDEYLEQAQSLVNEIRSGNETTATKALDELINARENSLFMELGKLTRDFHDALTKFRLDSKISDLVESDIPDARDRLQHVITMTNESAESTLNAVEKSIPLCDQLSTEAVELQQAWERFQRKDMQADEFRALSVRMTDFFKNTVEGTSGIKQDLNSVLMAQTFQDLTGQIIKQVITLVDDVENNLVNLVKLSSVQISADNTADKNKDKDDANSLSGPQIPGKESATAVSGQDEVDDLLSSLGF